MAAQTIKTWTRSEYERLVELGMLTPDDRAELVDGLIVKKMTHNPPHFTALGLAEDWLRSIVGPRRHVRAQGPIALSDMSEPEPDLVVVAGSRGHYASRHPKPEEVELLVEISHSSIDRDRRLKAPLYARAGVRELWIVDLDNRRLELHREPGPGGYRNVTTLAEDDSATPLFAPSEHVKVANLIPTSN